MQYRFYYWPMIQGRGEYVRLALEAAGADYVDVAREPEQSGGGIPELLKVMQSGDDERPPFAPPFLKAGKHFISHTPAILLYLGERHRLAPSSEAGKMWAHQLQLSITDFDKEIHDTHHPIASQLYYEDQKKEAKARAGDFLEFRAPKNLGYFEKVLERNKSGDGHLIGKRLTYPDLSLFQIVAGLRYAFPKAMRKLEKKYPRCVAVHDEVAAHRRVSAYLASERRIAFNEMGVFRHYEELDARG
jgi:glutathione S-transferase